MFFKNLAVNLLTPIFALRKTKKDFDSVAQLVEQYTFNVWVLGSSPSGITGKNLTEMWGFYIIAVL